MISGMFMLRLKQKRTISQHKYSENAKKKRYRSIKIPKVLKNNDNDAHLSFEPGVIQLLDQPDRRKFDFCHQLEYCGGRRNIYYYIV